MKLILNGLPDMRLSKNGRRRLDHWKERSLIASEGGRAAGLILEALSGAERPYFRRCRMRWTLTFPQHRRRDFVGSSRGSKGPCYDSTGPASLISLFCCRPTTCSTYASGSYLFRFPPKCKVAIFRAKLTAPPILGSLTMKLALANFTGHFDATKSAETSPITEMAVKVYHPILGSFDDLATMVARCRGPASLRKPRAVNRAILSPPPRRIQAEFLSTKGTRCLHGIRRRPSFMNDDVSPRLTISIDAPTNNFVDLAIISPNHASQGIQNELGQIVYIPTLPIMGVKYNTNTKSTIVIYQKCREGNFNLKINSFLCNLGGFWRIRFSPLSPCKSRALFRQRLTRYATVQDNQGLR